MDLANKVVWAEIKLKVLESAMMLNDGYTNEDVITKLLEVVELLENTDQNIF
jgi:hypothetical protein